MPDKALFPSFSLWFTQHVKYDHRCVKLSQSVRENELTSLALQLVLLVVWLLVGKILLNKEWPRHGEVWLLRWNTNNNSGVRSGTRICSLNSCRLQSDGVRTPETCKTTTEVGWILLTDRKVSFSYTNQRGEAAGWVGRSPPKDTPRVSGRHQPHSPQVPNVPKAGAKRKSNCAFHGCNGSLFTRLHARIVIKCEQMTQIQSGIRPNLSLQGVRWAMWTKKNQSNEKVACTHNKHEINQEFYEELSYSLSITHCAFLY